MGKIIKLSLQEEMKKEAEEIKENIAQHPELAQLEVREEDDAEFFRRANGLEARMEEERSEEKTKSEMGAGTSGTESHAARANTRMSDEVCEYIDGMKLVPREPGSSVYVDENGEKYILVYQKKKRKKPWLVALVAILVLVLGLGITSVGSKSYFKVLWERFAGEDENPMKILNVDDMDTMESEDGKEMTAYREVGEKLGIYVVEVNGGPAELDLIEVQIEEVLNQATIFYQYGDEIIRYTVYLNDRDSSWGETAEDEEIREYTLTVNNVDIIIREYKVEGYDTYRRVAKFSYRGVHYQLKGIMEQEEFEEILKNLHFF